MTSAEKKTFIRAFIRGIEKEMLSQLDRMPKDWDETEIRYHIGQKFIWQAEGIIKRNMGRKRLSNYRRAVYNNNL